MEIQLAQNLWYYTLDNFSEKFIIVDLPFIIVMVLYFSFGGLHLLLDIAQRPKWLYKYKIQPKRPLDLAMLPKLFANLFLCFSLIGYPTAYISYYWFPPSVSRTLPSVVTILGKLVASGVTYEALFYYAHRLFHVPILYKYVHKLHHEFQAPIALAASYSHPIEFFLVNYVTLVIPIALFQFHAFTVCVWFTVAVFSTQTHHSGYHFPWDYDPFGVQPEFHDFHHEKFNCCYGLMGFLDRLHGTDLAWRLAREKHEKSAKAE